MANDQGAPVGREWDYSTNELAENLGTPTADVRQVISNDRPTAAGEPTDEDGVVTRDEDGYVGSDGKMLPHQSPLEVAQRADMELDAPNLDREARDDMEDIGPIYDGDR